MSGATGALRSTAVAPDSALPAPTDQAIAFISYAREDRDFVFRLSEALQLKNVLVCGDWQLVRGENYDLQLQEMQLGSDAVVFVVSPESVRSGPCKAELDRASEQKKRVLPVVRRDLGSLESEMHPALALPQWSFLRDGDDFIVGVNGLVDAINTDFDLMPEHRRLLQAAEIWERHTRSGSYLLRKDGLKSAEAWFAETSRRPNKLPNATPLQLDYIRASRQARTHGNRVALTVTSAIAVTMAILAVIAYTQRNSAVSERQVANEQRDVATKQTVIAQEQKKQADDQRTIADQRRMQAEEATETERAARAVELAREPGREFEALTVALLAASNTIHRPGEPLRPAVVAGLASVVSAGLYSLPLRGHTSEVKCAAFSPDGKRLLTEGKDFTAKLWDTADGRLIASFPLHPNSDFGMAPISASSFSPDSRWVVTLRNEYRKPAAQIWDAHTGASVRTLSGHRDTVLSASFSSDGKRVVTSSNDYSVRIWNAETGQTIRELTVPHDQGPGGAVYSSALSPDGSRVATSHQDNRTRLWDVESGKLLETQEGGRPGSLAFYPDSRRFVPGGRNLAVLVQDVSGSHFLFHAAEVSPDGGLLVRKDNHTPGLLETATGKEVKPIYGRFGESQDEHSGDINYAAFSPNGRFLASASQDNTARVWNASHGNLLAILKGHRDRVWHAAFATDNRRLVTSSADRTARLWDTRVDGSALTLGEQIPEVRVFERGAAVNAAAFSPDGAMVVTAHEDAFARLWNARSGKLLAKLAGAGPLKYVAFSPDGSLILACSSTQTHIWSVATKKVFATLEGALVSSPSVFSPRGERVLTLSENEWKMWDLRSGKLIRRNSATRPKLAVFTRAGSGIAIGEDGNIELLDEAKTDRFQLIRTGMSEDFLAVSPDGLRIATPTAFEKDDTRPPQADRSFQIRDARTGALVRTVRGHTDTVNLVTFSPDGKRLLSAAADGSARTWDASTGEPRVVMEHGSPVRSAQFSPDGSRVLTITAADEISCWESESGHRLAVFQGHLGEVLSAAFSRDGTRVVTTGLDGTAKIFSAAEADLVRTYLTTAFRLLHYQPEYAEVKEIERDLPAYLRALR